MTDSASGPAETPGNAAEVEAPAAAPRATPAQRRAIEARGCDVVVAAGAGSGKTYVLVERFMGLVREGVAPDRLLTITFTEQAAREMKERIGHALAKEGVPEARRVAEGAWVSTIHGFCARLLRERALEAGVDPAFGVLTDVPASRLRRQAFLTAQRTFRAAYPGLYDGLVARVRWGKGRDGASQIRERVLSLYDQTRAAGSGLRGLGYGPPPRLEAIEREAVEAAYELLQERLRSLFATQALVGRGKGGVSPQVERRTRALGDLASKLREVPLDRFRLEAHRLLRRVADTAKGGGALADEIGEVRRAAEQAAEAYAEGPARALGRALEDLLVRFDQAFRALKAERSALDFTDLEEQARALLTRRPDVREALQRRFESVLVDEFQDTSRLQQSIVDLVRREHCLFAVGDVKQSIYGFRHAEVAGLLETTEQARVDGGEVVDLDRSFRTRPEILAFVDEVFARVWSEPGSEVPHQPLLAGIEFEPPPRPCVEQVLARGESLRAGRAEEARAVAARLATLVEGRQLRGTNSLRQENYGRPLSYRDCAILLPTTTNLYLYERALRARGVPYRVASGRGFYQAQEVVDAVHLLEVCADAHDDLALLAFLRSPAVGLSDVGLLALAEARPEEGERGKGSLFASLRATLESGGDVLQGRDARRALRGLALVRDLRELRGRASTREILERGLSESGLLEGSLLRAGDVRGYMNLRKLAELVEELEREGALGPGAVAAVLRDLRAMDARESEANVSSDDEDAVSVQTVHASKGLEWPLVVVGDCGRYGQSDTEPVLWSAETGVTLTLRDPDDERAAVKPRSLALLAQRKDARRYEESKRLLYVAMTRARDHLILAGAMGSKARTPGEWLGWLRAPVQWSAPPVGAEQDVAAGAQAKAFPSLGGVVVRTLEVLEEAAGAPLHGARGPAADAAPILDPRACAALARGQLPQLPPLDPAADARAAELLERVRAAGEGELDWGAEVTTVSEVLTWRRCPRQALYQYVVGDERRLRWRAGGEQSLLAPDLRGTLAHEVLAAAFGRGLPGARWIEGRAAQLLLPEVDPDACRETARWALALAEDFLLTPLAARARGAQARACERPLIAPVSGLGPPALLRGTVDLLFWEGSGWVLVDYKTGALALEEVPGRLAEDALQLELYALLLRGAGLPVREAWVAYLSLGVAEPVDLGPVERARDALGDYRAARREGVLPARPGKVCGSCPWNDVCEVAHIPAPEGSPEPSPSAGSSPRMSEAEDGEFGPGGEHPGGLSAGPRGA